MTHEVVTVAMLGSWVIKPHRNRVLKDGLLVFRLVSKTTGYRPSIDAMRRLSKPSYLLGDLFLSGVVLFLVCPLCKAL